MVTDPCLTPPTPCNNAILTAEATQRFLLLQLLNAALVAAGGAVISLSTLKTDGQLAYGCLNYGSTAAIRQAAAQLIAENLDGVVVEQPVCWTPTELEGAITYVTCALLNALASRIV